MRPDPLPELLAPFREHPDRAGVLTDFDGTLSTIVLDPDAARALPGARDVLADLARAYALVAVVSGRPTDFLIQHIGGPNVVLRGLYGLEGEPEAEKWRAVVDAATERACEVAPEGVLIEKKGLTLTLHYRDAPKAEPWVRTWTQATHDDTGLAIHAGRMALEMIPPVPIDKGTTVAALAAGLDAVCFLGDDVGDLAAFTALDHLQANGVTTMKVAVRSEESPPELLATANFIVDGPGGSLDLLRRLAL